MLVWVLQEGGWSWWGTRLTPLKSGATTPPILGSLPLSCLNQFIFLLKLSLQLKVSQGAGCHCYWQWGCHDRQDDNVCARSRTDWFVERINCSDCFVQPVSHIFGCNAFEIYRSTVCTKHVLCEYEWNVKAVTLFIATAMVRIISLSPFSGNSGRKWSGATISPQNWFSYHYTIIILSHPHHHIIRQE